MYSTILTTEHEMPNGEILPTTIQIFHNKPTPEPYKIKEQSTNQLKQFLTRTNNTHKLKHGEYYLNPDKLQQDLNNTIYLGHTILSEEQWTLDNKHILYYQTFIN